MRQHQFRAVYDGSMYNVTEIMWSNQTAYLVGLNDDDDGQTVQFNHIRFIEYTGLMDRDGKQIYEGDIVRFDGRQTATVTWDFTNTGYQPFIGDWHSANLGLVEVIGNIYVNLDLLK